jgi:NitT/TauT family transport system substrate-binding protein
MVAKEKGYYADEGLDVTIQEGQGSNSTASLVAGGKSEFGYADGPSGITVASQGGDLINIGPILQTNGFSVMSLKESGIETIADLEGKSVALQPGTAQASLFDAVLAANDVDPSSVEIVNLDPSALVASLLQGSVDAITAGADSQGVQLRAQGADINEVLYRDAGVPTVGLSMLTQASYAQEHPDIVKAFVSASLKGWDDAREDPAAAAEIVAKQFPDGAQVEQIEDQFAVDAELLCAPGATGLGRVPDENWQTTYDLMVDYLDLPTTKPITAYYTTDYLPAEGPSC